MIKYIDSEKLIAEIERQIEETKSMKPSFDQFWAGQISAFKGAIKIAESLQKEQPEVELEKAYKSYIESRKDDLSGNAVTVNMKDFARHFYERGQSIQYQKDRAEFAKLKAKEWQKGFDEGLNAGKEESK